jgi:dTDP-4-amino-4,6-dideoxygalactose transaminase
MKVYKNFFSIGSKYKNYRKKIHQKINQICSSGQFILGEDLEIFERNISLYLNSKNFIGVGNGTDALYLAIKSLGIGPGDKVITTPMSYIASTSSIYLSGATPIFVDVDESLNISPSAINEVNDKDVKAILVVHLGGNPAEMVSIMKIAKKKSIYVIEDCAQAFGTKLNGKKLGTYGDVNAFSFHPLKILGAFGDAGGISTDIEKLSKKIINMRNHGHITRDDVEDFSHNMRMDTIQAGILNIFLEDIELEIKLRQKQIATYRKKLNSVVNRGSIVFPRLNESLEEISFNFLIIRVRNRDALISFLQNNGYEIKIHYPKLLCDLSAIKIDKNQYPLVNSKIYVNEILSLPIGEGHKMLDIINICKLIIKFYKDKK